jgi:hypothetical protein
MLKRATKRWKRAAYSLEFWQRVLPHLLNFTFDCRRCDRAALGFGCAPGRCTGALVRAIHFEEVHGAEIGHK